MVPPGLCAALEAASFPGICANVVRNATMIASYFPPTPDRPNVTSMYKIANFAGAECEDPAFPLCVNGYCRGMPASTSDCRTADGISSFPLRTPSGFDPTAFSTASIAASVAAQAVVFFFVGALADYGPMRKRTLIISCLVGGISTIACAGITTPSWWLGAPLMIITNVAFGMCSIMYNAYLPVLVDALPQVRRETDSVKRYVLEMRLGNELSSKGFAWGYAAGILGILLCIPGAFMLSEIGGYQVAMVIVGAWWLIFSYVPWRWLKTRPGPPLPVGQTYVKESIRSIRTTLIELRRLPVSGYYLILWMIFSDGVFVIGTIGGLYANTEVQWGCMSKGIGVLVMFIIVPIVAGIGNVLYLKISNRWAIASKTMLVVALMSNAIIPFYGMLGFIHPAFGYRYGTELLVVCAWYGLHLGAMQAYSRAIFGTLIPRGKESGFFSLYELTNRGSSWVGPLALTVVKEFIGDIRWGWVFVFLNIFIPALFLMRLDVKKGKQMAETMSTFHVTDEQIKGDLLASSPREIEATADIELTTLEDGREVGGDEWR